MSKAQTYDPKRQQISRKEDNVTKESSVATVTKTPTEKGPLTVDTTVEGKSTAALVSPQNDDEKSTAEGTDDKDKGGTETETEEGKGKGSGLKTLSTAASMMSHQ